MKRKFPLSKYRHPDQIMTKREEAKEEFEQLKSEVMDAIYEAAEANRSNITICNEGDIADIISDMEGHLKALEKVDLARGMRELERALRGRYEPVWIRQILGKSTFRERMVRNAKYGR